MKSKIALLICSVLFVLLVLELFLRIVYPESIKLSNRPKIDWAVVPESIWTEYHPIFGWYQQKNKRAVLKLRDYKVEVHTNSIGIRGVREYSVDKSPAITRLLCLGDSFVFGFGVEDDEPFCAQLEASHPHWEFLNLGVAGYGIDQIYLMYREMGRFYRPDYVLVGIFPEDFWRATRSFADTGHVKPYFSLESNGELHLHNQPVPPKFSLDTNQFPEVVHPQGIEVWLTKSMLYRVVKKGWMKVGRELKFIDPNFTDEWILGRKILSQLIAEIRTDKAKPILVIMPPERWATTQRADSLRKSLIRFAQREQVDFIDLTPIFYAAIQKGKVSDYYIEGDGHWTANGHQLAANAIAEYFESHE